MAPSGLGWTSWAEDARVLLSPGSGLEQRSETLREPKNHGRKSSLMLPCGLKLPPLSFDPSAYFLFLLP